MIAFVLRQTEKFAPIKALMHMHNSLQMGQAMQKRILCHMQTTKVQISLRIRAVWLAPLLLAD